MDRYAVILTGAEGDWAVRDTATNQIVFTHGTYRLVKRECDELNQRAVGEKEHTPCETH